MVGERYDDGLDDGLTLSEIRRLLARVGSGVEPVSDGFLTKRLDSISNNQIEFTARYGFIIDCHITTGMRVQQEDLDRLVQTLRKEYGRYYRSGKITNKA